MKKNKKLMITGLLLLLAICSRHQVKAQSTNQEIDSLKNITILKLRGQDLAVLPSWILKCTGVKSIYLDYNPHLNWTEVTEVLSKLEKLESLSLRGNRLSSLPRGLFKLKHLSDLDVGNNELIDFAEDTTVLKSIESISVDDNKVDAAFVDALILHLPNLTTLSIVNGGLDQFPLAICKSNIKLLYLRGNSIKKLPDCIYEMINLKYLILSNNFYGYEKYENKLDVPSIRNEFKSLGKKVIVE